VSVINDYTGAIGHVSDTKQWPEVDDRDNEIGSLRKLVRDHAAEIARLRALGLEACDVARDCAAMDVPARIDEIRKELTRG